MYIWSGVVGFSFLFGDSSLTLPTFYSPVALSAGAAEVMFWFAVLVPVSPDWPQDIITILWPNPPPPHPTHPTQTPWPSSLPPPHPMTAGLAAAAHCWSNFSWAVPATVSFIALICSFLFVCSWGLKIWMKKWVCLGFFFHSAILLCA